ncbi:hypothetical protein SPRG_01280 [Saprolegnia parasitica CBS 223.65]|uniref:Uncharacterized protein n=1 Tax=Saprolegnia parasitica (strain CBS 223.65) TaxID=695850 RepID=A0A067D5L5_SAPPC|nr:hypothetical protein SPRG_01280 [Saprolegnia parasitica CBS 223.65]KDO34006.1 hypothetical protein SPRG_01280 [Saprolegnia parasitica CBS 223.65]|eukprot:XP_012194892.1 hypothetical protein SPRG_01280 [Saprolegnia parasitica CBS 223.65]
MKKKEIASLYVCELFVDNEDITRNIYSTAICILYFVVLVLHGPFAPKNVFRARPNGLIC